MKNIKKWLSASLSLIIIGSLSISALQAQDFVVSSYQSAIQLDRQSAVANGVSNILLRGVIRDSNLNPLPNIPIRILSSRGGIDTIITQPQTDQSGKFVSRIKSRTPGQVTLSVLAGDKKLFTEPTINFHTDSKTKNIGAGGFGQFLQASLFGNNNRAQTEYFVLEDLNSPLSINNNVSVKISAKDANGNVDPGYRGTIRFIVPTDPNAKIPADYTFTDADQGVHNFYLAISFGTIGQHKLVVKDTSDIRVAGEMDIDVVPRPGDGSNIDINLEGSANLQAGNISVNVPSTGSTFSSSRITLSGTAPGIQNLQLFDGPTLVSNTVPVNPDGTFTYQTPQLADGLHQFQFFSNDGTGQEFKSDKISVTIDQTPPSVLKVDLIPSNEAEPGEEVTVMVGSTEDLSLVEGIFQGQPLVFERMDERTFRAFIIAPNNGGAYPISVSAADLLGNTKNEPNAEVLYVKLPQVFIPTTTAAEPVETDKEYQSLNQNQQPPTTKPVENNPDENDDNTNLVPTSVVNLSAVPGDNRVTLFWSPATDDKGIKQYQINYDTNEDATENDAPSENKLLNINRTPDARTQWYIDGLEPCEKVTFTVTPIDTDDALGQVSNAVQSAAKCDRPNTTQPPKSGGSNFLSILLGMIFGGICVLFIRFRKTS
jgi:hypothetical protein